LPVGVPNTFSSSYRPTRGAGSPGRYSLASIPHRSTKARHRVDVDQLGGFAPANWSGGTERVSRGFLGRSARRKPRPSDRRPWLHVRETPVLCSNEYHIPGTVAKLARRA
jgi:hypothetical protein